MASKFYKLDKNKKPVEVENIIDTVEMFSNAKNRRIDKTLIGDVEVSTVFLCLDHNYSDGGPPLLFETMVFGGIFDGLCERYSTWEQAKKGHKKIVEKLGGKTVKKKEEKLEQITRFDIIDL